MSALDDWARSVASKYGVMALAYSQLATLFKNMPAPAPAVSGSATFVVTG